MPRPGNKRGGRRSWNENDNRQGKYMDEHDDRADKGITGIKRRVTFKHAGGPKKNNGRISDISIKTSLEDDDVMGEGPSEMRNFKIQGRGGKNNRGGRRGSPVPARFKGGGGFNKFKLLAGPSGWYSVTIPHGQKYMKNFIIGSILNEIKPEAFIPYYYKVNQNDVQFYVDDFAQAEAISKIDRKIETPDGFKLILKVKSGTPQISVDAGLKEAMRQAMVNRYSPATKALNLEKFHGDPLFADMFCSLARPTIMLAAIDIIAENISDIEALNLDNNKITSLDHMKSLPQKLPSLKIIYMGHNKINAFASLDAMKGLQLLELKLEGNPIQQRIKDHTYYVSEVRKRFPKLLKLDGKDLPPPIGFDVDDSLQLPKATASFICDEAGADIVRQFLQQYFAIYDSDNRQPLLDAYHEQAMLSMTIAYLQPTSNQNRIPQQYISSNRNLLRTRDLEQRCRHLKVGRLPVVSFLSELPATQHDPNTMVVDLTLFNPKLMQLTVTGVFKERKLSGDKERIRSFQRSLVIVPSGSGFCIRHEVFHINNATIKQEKNSFKVPNSFTEPIQQPTVAPVHAPPADLGSPDDNTKMQMVQALSAQSNMNVEWSRKCLEEKKWNYNDACLIFAELHKAGRIPPEAFFK